MHLSHIEKLLVFLIFVILMYTFSHHKNIKPQDTRDVSTQPNTNVQAKTLGITFSDFCERYNRQVAKYDNPQLRLIDFTHKRKRDRDRETIYKDLGAYVVLSIDMDSSAHLLEVTVLSDPDKGGKNAILYQTVAFDSVMAVLDSQLTEDERKGILNKCIKHIKNSAVTSAKYRYESRVYNSILMFSIKPL